MMTTPAIDPTLQPDGTTVFRMLDISTGALSEKAAQWLQAYVDDDCDGDGPVAYEKGEYGWIVHVAQELHDIASAAGNVDDLTAAQAHLGEDVPADLVRVLLYAALVGCQWVMFDLDGGEIPDALPAYDW